MNERTGFGGLMRVLGISGVSLVRRGGATGGSRGRRGLASALAVVIGAGLLATGGSVTAALAGPAAGAALDSAAGAAQGPVLASAVAPASGMLNAVLPQRILDTRTATGGHHVKLGPGATMTLQVVGMGGTPGGGVSAVLINVTAVNETARMGYLTLFPTGTRPVVSTLNYTGAVPIANQALVRVGASGAISIFNSAGTTNVIVDIEGWVGTVASAANGQTTTTTPVRLLDTRTANGGHKAPLGNGQSVSLQVAGVDGIPATGVAAVWANVTAVPVGRSTGYLTAYPKGGAAPVRPAVNFMPGAATANLTLLRLSAGGAVTITNHSGSANVLVDVARLDLRRGRDGRCRYPADLPRARAGHQDDDRRS